MSNRTKGQYMPHRDAYVPPRRTPRYARPYKPEVSDGCGPHLVALVFILLLAAKMLWQ